MKTATAVETRRHNPTDLMVIDELALNEHRLAEDVVRWRQIARAALDVAAKATAENNRLRQTIIRQREELGRRYVASPLKGRQR